VRNLRHRIHINWHDGAEVARPGDGEAWNQARKHEDQPGGDDKRDDTPHTAPSRLVA
jgi:hypothetical protein